MSVGPTSKSKQRRATARSEDERLAVRDADDDRVAATELEELEPYEAPSGFAIWQMRSFDFYVGRTFLFCYGICAVSFIGLFVSIEAFAKLDRFLRQEGSLLTTLWKYHTAMIPTVYTHYVGPILTAAAGMFTVTLLSRQNELTAMKAAGVSAYRIMLPIFVLAAAFTALTFYLQESVLPGYRGEIRQALAFSKGRSLKPDLFYDEEYGLSIRVAEYSTIRRVGSRAEILKRHPNLGVKTKIDAQQIE
ncbi:MAG: LptF/LptG family permease, partial [Planctomycetota bacterium]